MKNYINEYIKELSQNDEKSKYELLDNDDTNFKYVYYIYGRLWQDIHKFEIQKIFTTNDKIKD